MKKIYNVAIERIIVLTLMFTLLVFPHILNELAKF